ncbi:MAG: nucleotidyltransferase domain-containing protein [Nitrososphaerota archaeon]
MPSEKLLVSEAKRRAKIFKNINNYLKLIVGVVKGLDSNAEVYRFGSVAEGEYLLSSDIDVLIITGMPPANVVAELGESGITDPLRNPRSYKNMLEVYKARAKLIRIN